jgi:hypothetical protein
MRKWQRILNERIAINKAKRNEAVIPRFISFFNKEPMKRSVSIAWLFRLFKSTD